MTTWTNLARTTIPRLSFTLVAGSHRYRIRGVCANGTQTIFPTGVWATK